MEIKLSDKLFKALRYALFDQLVQPASGYMSSCIFITIYHMVRPKDD